MSGGMSNSERNRIARALLANSVKAVEGPNVGHLKTCYPLAPCVLESNRFGTPGQWHMVAMFDLAAADEYHYIRSGVEALAVVDQGVGFRICEASAEGLVLQTYTHRTGWVSAQPPLQKAKT
jgi:hypothetical protein